MCNKVGWVSEDGYYSTCDAGLIDIDAVERPLERGYGRDCKGSV